MGRKPKREQRDRTRRVMDPAVWEQKERERAESVQKTRVPRNPHEAALYHILAEKGCTVLKRGWPDFLVLKDGHVALIEVKPKRSHRLKAEQAVVMGLFAQAGITCYRWNPPNEFTPIPAGIPAFLKDSLDKAGRPTE